VPSIEKGIREAMGRGVLAGYPVVDVKVRLHDGSYHEVDSNEMAFKMAGSMGFKEGCRKAKPVLLEPVMDVEVVTPSEFQGAVVGDLNSRRGKILSMEARANAQVIRANVPLGQMFGYATDVRSMTQGRATYTMHFDHYAPVPQSIADGLRRLGIVVITAEGDDAKRLLDDALLERATARGCVLVTNAEDFTVLAASGWEQGR